MHALSKILRHSAVKRGLTVSEGGWVMVEQLLALPELRNKSSLEKLMVVVRRDQKGRFAMKQTERGWVIRANQGHTFATGTISSQKLCKKQITFADLPHFPFAFHGTTRAAWETIKSAGLCRMQRQHIHFASSQHARSGIRARAEVLIELDLEAVLAAGIPVYLSTNDVLLCSGAGGSGCLPPRFFKAAYTKDQKPLHFSKHAAPSAPSAAPPFLQQQHRLGSAAPARTIAAAAAPSTTAPSIVDTAKARIAEKLKADESASDALVPGKASHAVRASVRASEAPSAVAIANGARGCSTSIWTSAVKRQAQLAQANGSGAQTNGSGGNIGFKMLKTMGWSGSSGLGKKSQGITAPIGARRQQRATVSNPYGAAGKKKTKAGRSESFRCPHWACKTAALFESKIHLHVHKITAGH